MKASGNLLPSLALLDQLQELHLDRNWFNGTLPPAFAYGFPALISLRLDFNSLTVGDTLMQGWLCASCNCIIVAMRQTRDMHSCTVSAGPTSSSFTRMQQAGRCPNDFGMAFLTVHDMCCMSPGRHPS